MNLTKLRRRLRTFRYACGRALPLYPWRNVAISGGVIVAGRLLESVSPSAYRLLFVLGAIGILGAVFLPKLTPLRLLLGAGGLVSIGCGVALGYLGVARVGHWLVLLGLAAVVALTLIWLIREVVPAQTTRAAVERRGDRVQRAGGVASIWDIGERGSRKAICLDLPVLRPTLAHVPLRRRNPYDAGVLVATNGLRILGTRWTRELWSGCRDMTLRVGPPGCNKSISLAVHALTAPGAVITTSTKKDIAENTHDARSKWLDGTPRTVWFFNPTGFAGIVSTVYWNILYGCEHYATAWRRAKDLIPRSISADSEIWDRKARLYLALLLHAAAIAERRVEDVERWIANLGDGGDLAQVHRELTAILAGSPSKLRILNGMVTTTAKTRSGAVSQMAPAVAWMADDDARLIGAAPMSAVFDIPAMIRNGETLHIIGPNDTGPVTNLTGALIAEFKHQAEVLSGTLPSGRLDPPLTLIIDELAVAARLPLDEWSSDMGGRGVTIHAAAQSLAQLRDCYGDAGHDVLLGNVGSLILFGGGKDARELDQISKLFGVRRQRVVGEDADDAKKIKGIQRGEWQHVPVASPADLCNTPAGHVWVIKRGLGGAFYGTAPTLLNIKGWKSVALGQTAAPGEIDTLPLQRIPELEEAAA